MQTLPSYAKRNNGYSAAGAARWGNTVGIEGDPYRREVKKNSKSEQCHACREMIPVNAGMHGWVASIMVQKSTCSHLVKNETLWFCIPCCPESDPRMPEELARRANEQRKIERAQMKNENEDRKRSREENGSSKAPKTKKAEEFNSEVLALSDAELEKRAIVDVEHRGIWSAPNSIYLKQHCGTLSIKKSGTRRELLMRLITAMEARGITMHCDTSNYSNSPPYGHRGTLHGPDGKTL